MNEKHNSLLRFDRKCCLVCRDQDREAQYTKSNHTFTSLPHGRASSMRRSSPKLRKKNDGTRHVLSPNSQQPSPKVLKNTSQLSASCDQLLEESLSELHKTVKQVRSSPPHDENQKETIDGPPKKTPEKMPSSNDWIMGVFKDLNSEKRKKDNYKNQLKEALKDRLKWLEKQLQSADQVGCMAAEQTEAKARSVDPSGTILPSISLASTLSTHESSSGEAMEPNKVLSPREEEEGYEISFQYQEPRARELESTLAQTLQQHERERKEWFKTLEDATMATVAGQQLSSQQEKQLRELQEQFAAEQLHQRKQLKEKSRVLMELLELTEQQQEHERKEWEEEVKLYELTISRMASEKAKVEAQVKTTVKELAETQSKVKALNQERQMLKREKEATATHLSRIAGEKNGWKADEKSYEDTVTQLIAEKESMRKQILRLQSNLRDSPNSKPPLVLKASPGRISKLEQALDRVTAERDLGRQELEKVQGTLASEKEEKAKLSKQVQEAAARLQSETVQWQEKIDAKDREILETKSSVEKEVVKRMEEVLKERQESGVAPCREESEGDLAAKLEESVQKRNELVSRLRKLEAQRDKDKGDWKLQLEAALAKSRHAEAMITDLKQQLDKQRAEHEEKLSILKKESGEQQAEFEARTSEIRTGNTKLEQDLAKALQEISDAKKVLDEKKDSIEKLQSENAKIRGELAEKKDQIAILEAENLEDREQMRKEASEIEAKHDREIQRKKSHLMHSEAEVRMLTERVNELKKDLSEAKEIKDRFESQSNDHAIEIEQWKKQVQELQDEINKVSSSKKHSTSDLLEWKDLARKSQEEACHLTDLLEDVKADKEKLEAQLQQLRLERDRVRYERRSRDRLGSPFEEEAMSKHKDTICEAIEELRRDVIAVRDTIETSRTADDTIAGANFAALKSDMEQLQASLNDVCAELTLETEAMYETRNAINTLAKSPPRQLVPTDLPEGLSTKIAELNESIKSIVESGSSRAGTDTIRLELVSQLQSKEAALVKCTADLEEIRRDFHAEIKKREKAEAEVRTLNDQADAYTEELMHLQADNSRLNVTLKEAERKMVSVLYGKRNEADIDAFLATSRQNKTSDGGESMPLLEGALALAESLSDIVQGKNDEGKETTVMEMLESLSKKMDLHDRGELPGQVKSEEEGERLGEMPSFSPLSIDEDERRLESFNFGGQTPGKHSDSPPKPIETPLEIHIPCSPGMQAGQIALLSPGGQGLQAMVEQLYGRCQLLERERLEMMQTTLDLLEAARASSKAELDAALACARRKASEDVLRARDENIRERERLYHKLCRNCVRSLPCDGSECVER